MPSIISTIVALTACLTLASTSAIPQEESPANPLLEIRATLETCPGIDRKNVRGDRFKVYCDRDTEFDGDHEVKLVEASNFDDCMGKCEGVNYRDWCKRVSWGGKINERGTCYMKGGPGTGNIDGRYREGWKLGRRY